MSYDRNKTAAILTKPVEPPVGYNHKFKMDNFYDSPKLIFFLKSNKLFSTLHFQTKKHLPLVKTKEAEKRKTVWSTFERCRIKWLDKKSVTMISNGI
jgi:hypothetical protein